LLSPLACSQRNVKFLNSIQCFRASLPLARQIYHVLCLRVSIPHHQLHLLLRFPVFAVQNILQLFFFLYSSFYASGKFLEHLSRSTEGIFQRAAIALLTTHLADSSIYFIATCLALTKTEAQVRPRNLKGLAKVNISTSKSPITTTRSSSKSSGLLLLRS